VPRICAERQQGARRREGVRGALRAAHGRECCARDAHVYSAAHRTRRGASTQPGGTHREEAWSRHPVGRAPSTRGARGSRRRATAPPHKRAARTAPPPPVALHAAAPARRALAHSSRYQTHPDWDPLAAGATSCRGTSGAAQVSSDHGAARPPAPPPPTPPPSCSGGRSSSNGVELDVVPPPEEPGAVAGAGRGAVVGGDWNAGGTRCPAAAGSARASSTTSAWLRAGTCDGLASCLLADARPDARAACGAAASLIARSAAVRRAGSQGHHAAASRMLRVRTRWGTAEGRECDAPRPGCGREPTLCRTAARGQGGARTPRAARTHIQQARRVLLRAKPRAHGL
jgi:hypothetical protein